MATVPTVTMELRTARDNESGPSAATQLFTTLPNPPSGLRALWQNAPEFTFEWLNQGQTIYSFITLPLPLKEHIHSQLVANYPEILIQPLEHNPLDEFYHERPKVWGELELTAASYYPLRTNEDFADVDPLATVLSALSKLQTDEAALIQLQVRKVHESWKNSGYSAMNSKPSSGEGAAPAPAQPHRDLITRKLREPGLAVRIHVVAQAPTKERAQQIFESLTTAFNVYHSEANGLKVTRPLWGRANRLEQILTRQVPIRKQYLTVKELSSLFHLPNKQLSTIRNIAWGKNLRGEPPGNLPVYTNITAEQQRDINLYGRADYKNQSQVFGIMREDRRRHMYVVGKSGTGKSTLLANMIINDLKHDEGIAVVDPHGDLIETVLNYIPKHRINDVIIIDPADMEAVVKLNLFEAGSSVHRELVASGIVSIFQKLYGHTWGPRLEYILRNTLMTLLYHNAKLSDILRILTDKKYRDAVVENTSDPVLQNFWTAEFNRMNEKQRVDAISPILNKVGQFVTSPLIRNVVNSKYSSFSIEEIMDEGKILLVNVSQGKLGEDNAALLGAMIITKIQLAAMNRVYRPENERRDFYLYIDEFQNFATTSFVKILSEARKYRLNLILANQYVDQIPEEVRSAIFGNAGNLISFIVGANDGGILEKEFGGKYTMEDLVSLGRYQVVTRMLIDSQMSQPFPAATLHLAKSANKNRDKVVKVSRERYARKLLEAAETDMEFEIPRSSSQDTRERDDRSRDDRDGQQRDTRPPRRDDRPQQRDDRPRDPKPRDERERGDRDGQQRDSRPPRRDDRPQQRDDRPRDDRPREDRPRPPKPREEHPPGREPIRFPKHRLPGQPSDHDMSKYGRPEQVRSDAEETRDDRPRAEAVNAQPAEPPRPSVIPITPISPTVPMPPVDLGAADEFIPQEPR